MDDFSYSRSPHSSSGTWLVWGGWVVFAAFLHVGPSAGIRGISELLQAGVGRTLAVLPDSAAEPDALPGEVHPDRVEQLQAENRELRRQLAELRVVQQVLDQQQQRAIPAGDRLLKVTELSTRVLGRKGDPLSSNLQLLIALGKADGLHEYDLVLAGDGLLVEGGTEQQLHSDQIVTAGQSLFGRVSRVGKRTALVQPLTDESFKIAVRIYRRSPLGAIEGPGGVLSGTGQGCRLDEIPATEAVAVGDEVYTDPVSSPTNTPIYCGRIVVAELSPTAQHWTLIVATENSPRLLPRRLELLKSEF